MKHESYRRIGSSTVRALFGAVAVFLGAANAVAEEAETKPSRRAFAAGAVLEGRAASVSSADALEKLPPLPLGVEDLKFKDFFVMPVGPRGLEMTARLRAADGHRVRLLGYMVRQSRPAPGVLLLTPYPSITRESEEGFCEDLPPQVVHVIVPEYADIAVPYTPGLLLLTGRLEIGPREEVDGRRSIVRLHLDPRENLPGELAASLGPDSTSSGAAAR